MIRTAEQYVVPPFLAVNLAIAERVTKGHEGLSVPGITVVPDDPEVGAGDAETLEGLVRAVRPGHPVDERCRCPSDRGRRRWCGCRLRRRLRLRRNCGCVRLQ